ncbi:FABP family protein [Fodinicola acaciae]|uniref:FABP family protein n=1 Tax=Fodinicola acaciae TaxID=2681555 RepID=UPI0013D2D906|nr:FABP family protein [Fodinicola acaciae]
MTTELNPACRPLRSLLGKWRGDGAVDYPTIDGPRRFSQEITVAHDGRPFLSYESRTWLLDADGTVVRPAAREVGWWRPQPESVELVLAHSSGIVEVFYGKFTGGGWQLQTDVVVPTRTAKSVDAATRLYRISDGVLEIAEQRAMVGQPLQPHTSARLTIAP